MALEVIDHPLPGDVVVRELRLSRPEKRNALNAAQLSLLHDALRAAAAQPAVRTLLLTGAAPAFCAGYDLDEPFDPDEPDTGVVETMQRLRDCPLPVLAFVDGPAFGAGLELAISADLRIASTSASFCLPPARLGIAYAPRGLARLVSLVGTAGARRLALGGDVVDAGEALSMGLVDRLGDRAEALRWAERLAAGAPLAMAHMKATLNALEEAAVPLDVEREQRRRALFFSTDAIEGREAFRLRRKPRFRGV